MNNDERKIFWDKLCSLHGEDLASDSIDLISTLKYPHSIFRYRPMNMASLEALQTNTLYFSSPYFYDDPFDTYISIEWDKIKNQIESIPLTELNFENFIEQCKKIGFTVDDITYEKFAKVNLQQAAKSTIYQLSEVIRPHIQKNLYSICFAEDPLNENLWLKYGGNHRGFCVEYDLTDETQFLSKNSPMSLYPVYYSDSKYNATNYALNLFYYYVLAIKNPIIAQQFSRSNPMPWEVEKISLIKHRCHEYDAEWRIITHDSERRSLTWIPAKLYIGLKAENPEKSLIIRAAVQAGIQHIYTVVISPKDYLESVELSDEDKKKYL